jgi:hypothetical protein
MKRHAARLLSLSALCSLFAAAVLLTGCGGSPSVEEVHRELQSRFPHARFEPVEHIHLGRISLGLLHGLVRMTADDDQASTIVSGIGGVDYASYKVRDLPDLDGLAGSPRFAQQLARSGWSLMVRTRENAERTWVYVRSDEKGALRNLFVVSLEKDELTLVRLDGHLDRAVAAALAEHPKSMFDGKKRKKKVETAEVAAHRAGRSARSFRATCGPREARSGSRDPLHGPDRE